MKRSSITLKAAVLMLSMAVILVALNQPGWAGEELIFQMHPMAMGGRVEPPMKTETEKKVTEPALMIRIGDSHFDPLYQTPSSNAALKTIEKYEPGQKGYFIVQFNGPIQPEWKTVLQQSGAEIFDYLPDFSFIVRMPSDNQTIVKDMPDVRWVGIYQPAFRISQGAMSKHFSQGADENAAMTTLRINLFPGVDLTFIQARITELGGVVKESHSSGMKTTLKIGIPANRIADLPAIEGVKWIEPTPDWKLSNDVSTDIMNVRTPRDTYGLYGSGQVVGVADTGLDQGSTAPASLHDDFEDGSGASRVLQIIDRVTASETGVDTSDINGHGTHVAGSVLGNGALSGSDPATDDFPASAHAGMAPKASLIFQALENNDTGALDGLPNDLNTLFSQAEAAGANLHTNSWGASMASIYTSWSQDVDEYMWDHPNFLILFAASNDGIDMDADGVIDLYSIGTPATAKNCLTVGASEGDRPAGAGYDDDWGNLSPLDYATTPVRDDHVSNNDRGIAAFSSRGPTLDGRYKPDIVVPGTNILSTRTGAVPTADLIGWGNFNDDYVWFGGTSMATPLAAGTAALMREYLMTQKGFTTPSAALIKAALINSAEDISPGQYGTAAAQEIPDSPVPNNVEGWGRLNLGDGIFPAAPFDILYFDETTGLDTGGSANYVVNVADPGTPLKINLTWTDYPGSPSAQGGLVNDLDLQITGPTSSVFYPDNALQKQAVNTISYDNNYPEGYVFGVNRFATRFTPNSYPVNIDSVSVLPINNVPGTGYKLVIYDDNGSANMPGTVLYSKDVPYIQTSYFFVTIPVEGVAISTGDFYVSVEVTNTGDTQGIVYDSLNSGRTYYYSGSGWSTISNYNWYIRANVRAQDYSTSFDRVNNTVGISIDAPAAGPYIIKVAGYNIPQGPQPYALVASGNISLSTAGIIQFGQAFYRVDENAGTITVTVTRTDGGDGPISVDYATSDNTATAGSDYIAASGTLTWVDGDSSEKSFNVDISDDVLNEGDETVSLTLSNATGGAALGADAAAVLTIRDDEPGYVQFSSATYSANESAGSVTITVTRTNGSGGAASVDFATSAGTAVAGSDYTAANGTLNWSDDDSGNKSFTVIITNDLEEEPDETLNLTLSNATGAALGGNTAAVLTITANDTSSSGGGRGGGGGGGGGCFISTMVE